MTDYRIELQAFVDAAASFTEPALGHHKAWAEAVARARVALSVPESSANTVCSITPPPELVQKWISCAYAVTERGAEILAEVATQAARWGADMELEACCEWVRTTHFIDFDGHEALRAARRPKPPSLKEQALKALDDISIASYEQNAANTIRQALEALND